MAADYPNRPVRFIVGYPAGGATDILARLFGDYYSRKTGQQFIIENRPGAGNNIGTEAVIKSPPDGYTVLLVNPANGINASLYKKLTFNFVKEIEPIAGYIRVPNVMEVHPSVPHIQAGNLRALGVTTAVRSEAFPDVPAIGDTVKGYEASAWFGIAGPKGMPRQAVELINKLTNEALKDPQILVRLKQLGGINMGGTPEDFGKVIVSETEKWAKVVKAANLSVE
jgi:tripartite-type tricarboxylate transporter receptor subunit TctC